MLYSDATTAGAPRRLSRILFAYFAREFLLPLVCCLLVFSALFLVADLFDILRDILGSERVTPSQLLLYFLVRQANNLPQVLPMSALLSASFMVSNFQRHHELTAMRTAGLSLFSCALPVWVLGFLLALASFTVGETIAPQSGVMAEQILSSWKNNQQRQRLKKKILYPNFERRRDWAFEYFSDRKDGEHEGIFIVQFRPDHTIEWELRAQRAKYVDGKWVFFNGERFYFDDLGQLPVHGVPERFAEKEFPELDETPLRIINRLRPVEELSIRQMLRVLKVNPNLSRRDRQEYYTTVWYRLFFPLSCLIGTLIGVSLSISNERSGALRGFALALGLMVIYYVSSQMLLVLGQNGHLPPIIGGAFSTVAFGAASVWEMHRKR